MGINRERNSSDCVSDNSNVLYGRQTTLTLQNMSFSGNQLSQFSSYIRAAAQVKKSCALANGKAGLISEYIVRRICSACDRIAAGEFNDQFPVDVFHGGGGIGINMNLNEVIATIGGNCIDPIDHVNLNQSTSDVCHTSLRIALIYEINLLIPVIEKLIHDLELKAKKYRNVNTIARTCWQDGLSVSAAALFEGTSSALKRNIAKLGNGVDNLSQVNLGMTVIGSGAGASIGYRERVISELKCVTGLNLCWPQNAYDAAQYPDDLVLISSELRVITGILAKFSKDIRILSSGPETGLREFNIPDVQDGSSFFPGKVNPVIPEMMIQCGMLMEGNDCVIQSALSMGECHINLWEVMMGFLLIKNFSMLNNASKLLYINCLSGLLVNIDVCEKYAASRVPLIVKYKEKLGYRYLSEWIKRDGIDVVVGELYKMESGCNSDEDKL